MHRLRKSEASAQHVSSPFMSDWHAAPLVTLDTLHPGPANFLAATLDRSQAFKQGDALPHAWHWCYFLSAAQRSNLGYDGHAEKGAFLPPIDLPRRMWGGSRFVFHSPLCIGDTVKRVSNVIQVKETQGKSGPLAFVTVKHEYFDPSDALCVEEEHDIVYRGYDADKNPDKPIHALPAPAQADVSVVIAPDSVLLFRYSALTFNGHRIHYDVSFCRNEEGYRHLVVHGPLVATLLLNLAADHNSGRTMKTFSFKAKSPLFCDAAFSIHGKHTGNTIALWAANESGGLAMEACATF